MPAPPPELGEAGRGLLRWRFSRLLRFQYHPKPCADAYSRTSTCRVRELFSGPRISCRSPWLMIARLRYQVSLYLAEIVAHSAGSH
ncbi:MAG: hypothetical protein UZ07_CHB004000756 [Chlorobi bacterium OLB7]|nr:MAG: hypothetical protein UZ07_CHB004000756 [Chlorobi bacterium OLB7]